MWSFETTKDFVPVVNFPKFTSHAKVPHKNKSIVAPRDDLPVIHLYCGDLVHMSSEGRHWVTGPGVINSHPEIININQYPGNV